MRATLSWALEHDRSAGERLVIGMIDLLRSVGAFRESSPNYAGSEQILDAIGCFQSEGFELALNGELRPVVLDGLSGLELTHALETYVRRAKQGATDAALLSGTGKDLVEATARHVVKERYGQDDHRANFPTVLEWAFLSLGMATPKTLSCLTSQRYDK